MLSRLNKVLICAAVLLIACPAQSQEKDGGGNWPNWRGPAGDGVAAENANPPLEWSDTKNVKWKIEVPGKGISTPIVWGNQIIVTSAVPTGKPDDKKAAEPKEEPPPKGEGPGGKGKGKGRRMSGPPPSTPYEFVVISYDRETGKQNWSTKVNEAVPHEGVHGTNTFASASPVTDGNHIFASFGSNGIYCLDMKGKEIWKKDLGKMKTRASFGEGASPALHGDTLVVPWDHEAGSFIVALDAKSGTEKWRKDRDEPSSWSTPLITEYKGVTQVITNGTKRARSYDLKDGSLIWECGGQSQNPIPTPIRDGDYVLVMTGYSGFSIQSIALDSKGDVTDSDKVRWSKTDAAPYVPTGVLYKGNVYFTKSRDPRFSILRAENGETLVDQESLPGLDGLYASLVAANDHIFALGRNGSAVVLKHGNKLNIVGKNKIDEGIDASPIVLGNQLFIRGHKHLFCFEKK
ncbi:MAG: PQQ-binding-like beta-propeller repeat protein [Pirellulaceae bacterium]